MKIYVDDYSGTTLTRAVQSAFFDAVGKEVVFSDKKYQLGSILVPDGVKAIDLNGATIVWDEEEYDRALFIFRLQPKINLDNFCIKNGHYDGNYLRGGLFGYSATTTFINLIRIENVHAVRTTGAVYQIYTPEKVDDNTGYVKKLEVTRCSGLELGELLSLRVNGNYPVGANTVEIRSKSLIPTHQKIKAGMYISFSTMESVLMEKGGYFSNAKNQGTSGVYRVTSVENIGDGVATVGIISGEYDNTQGFTPHNTNTGLRAPLIKHSAIYTLDGWDYPGIAQLPKVDCIKDSYVWQMVNPTPTEIGHFNNFYVGQKIGTHYKGIRTVVSIDKNNYSLVVDKPNEWTMFGQRLTKQEGMGQFINIYGVINKAEITYNYIKGANHFIRSSGVTSRHFNQWKKIPTSYVVENNHIENCWMGIEMQNGANKSQPIKSFGQLSFVRGGNDLLVTNPSDYKYTSVGGLAAITNSTTIYPTADNSLMVGDVVVFHRYKGYYQVKSIPVDFEINPMIIFERWKPRENRADGGFYKTAQANGEYIRVYSVVYGTAPAEGHLRYAHNHHLKGIRNGGGSYALSVAVGKLDVFDNTLDNKERTHFEVSAEEAIIKENKITGGVWQGEDDDVYGVSYASGKSAGYLALLSVSNLIWENNKYSFPQPKGYFNQAGQITLGDHSTLILDDYEHLIIRNNVHNDVQGRILRSSNEYYGKVWDYFEYSDNKHFCRTDDNFNHGVMLLLGEKNLIEDNKFIFTGKGTFKRLMRRDTPEVTMYNDLEVVYNGNYANKPIEEFQ